MKYDPSWFMERELFVQQCRDKIESFTDEDTKNCAHEFISFWEDIMGLYRAYVDCFDRKEKKVRRKVLRYAIKEFHKCLKMLNEHYKNKEVLEL